MANVSLKVMGGGPMGDVLKAKVEEVINFKPVLQEIPKELTFIENSKKVKYGTELYHFKKGVVLGPGDTYGASMNPLFLWNSSIRTAICNSGFMDIPLMNPYVFI